MKKKNASLAVIVEAVLILVVGVMFCCSKAMGNNALSWVIGASFMIGGVGLWLVGIVGKKALFNEEGFMGTLLFAFGLVFGLTTATGLLFYLSVWVLIVGGSVILLDCILRLAIRKDKNTVGLLIEFLIGAAALALGLCLYLIPEFGEFSALVLGIVLIVYSVFMIINELALSKKK